MLCVLIGLIETAQGRKTRAGTPRPPPPACATRRFTVGVITWREVSKLLLVFDTLVGTLAWLLTLRSFLGEVVCERWEVLEMIGQGTFSRIFSAIDLQTGRKVQRHTSVRQPFLSQYSVQAASQLSLTICVSILLSNNLQVAVKIEKQGVSRSLLRWESRVLDSLQGSSFVCKHHHFGELKDRGNILVCTLNRILLSLSPHCSGSARTGFVLSFFVDAFPPFSGHGVVLRECVRF